MQSMEGNEVSLLVAELSHVQELVRQLEVHLQETSSCSSMELCKHLASQILCLTHRSIAMVQFCNSGHRGPDTPSPLSEVTDSTFTTNKKRKAMTKWKSQIRVSSAGGIEGPTTEDGYSWRKYGQKDILGAKHPRGYYRCTHRNSQGCLATKQVQRTDEDPMVFDVIYHGEHTCVRSATGHAAKRQHLQQNPQAQILLHNLGSSLTVKTEGLGPVSFPFPQSATAVLEVPECDILPLSPEKASPGVSESNGLSMSPCQVTGHGERRSEGDIQEVVSVFTAAAEGSPVVTPNMDFVPEYFEFDPSFDLDPSCFF